MPGRSGLTDWPWFAISMMMRVFLDVRWAIGRRRRRGRRADGWAAGPQRGDDVAASAPGSCRHGGRPDGSRQPASGDDAMTVPPPEPMLERRDRADDGGRMAGDGPLSIVATAAWFGALT